MTLTVKKKYCPKECLLKEGAKVILLKNIGNALVNGLRGIVHKVKTGSPPIVNFNEHLGKVTETRFDVFDTRQQKTLA